MHINGRAFVVTGGASGLGRAAAEALLAAGGKAVLLDVNAEAGTAAERSLGGSARFALADVTSEDQVKAAVDLAVSAFGNLFGVVNAAGIGHLRGMAVRPAHAGHGHAAALLTRAEADLAAAGCITLTLDTVAPLLRAIAFYERHGYSPTGNITDFFGMPLYEYAKRLGA